MCDQNGCYKYELLDSKMPYPNGEVFSPSTGRLENRRYRYVNCCEDENGVNICNKDLSKLKFSVPEYINSKENLLKYVSSISYIKYALNPKN